MCGGILDFEKDGTSFMRLGKCVARLTFGTNYMRTDVLDRRHYLGTTCFRDETDTTSRVTIHDKCVKSVQGELCMRVTKISDLTIGLYSLSAFDSRRSVSTVN